MADAAIDAFAGTGKPYIEISGLWVYGANTFVARSSSMRLRWSRVEGADRSAGSSLPAA